MAPEYGATIGYFPVDAETLRYMRLTGRPEEVIARTEAYCQPGSLPRGELRPTPNSPIRSSLTSGSVVPSLAGPKRPQDRVALTEMKETFQQGAHRPGQGARLRALRRRRSNREATFGTNGGTR